MPTYYDYQNQAWVENGVYTRCGHVGTACKCFGRLHEGEQVAMVTVDPDSGATECVRVGN